MRVSFNDEQVGKNERQLTCLNLVNYTLHAFLRHILSNFKKQKPINNEILSIIEIPRIIENEEFH